MSARIYDAIVIGGGVNGLTTAAYLAKARKNVLLLEAGNGFGGIAGHAQTLYALDPNVLKDLKLVKQGLSYAIRDMPLTALRHDGKHIVMTRDAHATAASIAIHSQRDADAWHRFCRELFDLARAARPLWWEGGSLDGAEHKPQLDRIGAMGAAAWLDSWFETDALKAALCFDACDAGTSIIESGSASLLVWRAAQEISGLQGAVAFPKGGMTAFVQSLVAAAQGAGAELRTGARVSRFIMDGNQISGVELASGEPCFAPVVLCSLPRRHALAAFAPTAAQGFARASRDVRRTPDLCEARVTLTTNSSPSLGGVPVPLNSRFVVGEKPETYVAAELAARRGETADELPVQFTIPTIADPSLASLGQHVVSAFVRPIPLHPVSGWEDTKAKLLARVVETLAQFMPDLPRSILQSDVFITNEVETPDGSVAERLQVSASDRIAGPIHGLFFCGSDAEPVPAISGRAARIAAQIAVDGVR